MNLRHEEYRHIKSGDSFVLFADLERSAINVSKEMNWHDNLEFQFCTAGEGVVLIDGEKYIFRKGDVMVIHPNAMHYTYTDTHLDYSALLFASDFLRQMGIDCDAFRLTPRTNSRELFEVFLAFKSLYESCSSTLKTAKQNDLLLRMLIIAFETFSAGNTVGSLNSRSFEKVKRTIEYIRLHFGEKITLDELARNVYTDKYYLSREFKRITGQTIVEYMNLYRCQRAADCLLSGYGVCESAEMCGFSNFSYFTKTFKKQIGLLPSQYQKQFNRDRTDEGEESAGKS